MKARRYIVAAVSMLLVMQAQAQNLHSAYYTDNYLYRHAMNPAYDNEQSYVAIPGLGNLNVNTKGNFGYEAVVMNNPLAGQPGEKKMVTFMHPSIDAAAALSDFSTGNNRIVGNVGIAVLSAGFKAFGGYNTVEINSKTSFGVSLPYELFEFAKNIGNRSYDIGDINAGAMSYVELAFGHSRKITEKLRVGAKMKLLFGLGRADVKMENVKAELDASNRWLIQANAVADVSMKGFSYKVKEKEYKSENRGSYQCVNKLDVSGFGIGGFGVAFDLGGIYKINEDWTVNASLLDLGFISWSNDMQARNMSGTFEFDGLHDVSVSSSNPGPNGSFKSQGQEYSDQLADFANLQDVGDQGGRTTGLGATLNAGVEYSLPVYRKMTFGFLSSTRINGSFSWTEGRLSANWKPLKWLDGGINFAVGSLATSMGWVLNVHPKGFNFFIGMDHILGKTSAEFIPLSSRASANIGMNITW